MKAKMYDKSCFPTNRSGSRAIRVSGKAGLISFSKAFCEQTDFGRDFTCVFIEDETRPGDWYVAKSLSIEAFKVRNKKAGSCFNNVGLARRIIRSLGHIETDALKFKLSPEPINITIDMIIGDGIDKIEYSAYALITAPHKKKKIEPFKP